MLFDKYVLKELELHNFVVGRKFSKSEISYRENCIKRYILSIHGIKVLYIYLDKDIMMGTVGVREGKMIASAFDYATRKKMPVIAVVASAGIRVSEGTLALMQMANMALSVKKHSERGLLYIAIVKRPTLGGASASFVSLADIIISETDAIYGFSGRRIIENTTHEQLSDDFQTADFAKKNGQVDIVLKEKDIEKITLLLLKLHERR